MQENIGKSFLINSVLVLLTFVIVFYGMDYLSIYRNVEQSLSTSIDLRIPYIEDAFIIYYSVFLLPFFIPFCVKRKSEVRLWAKKMIVAIIIAGFIFLIFPTKNDFHEMDIARTKWVADLASLITGTYNMMPSLHVTLSIIIWGACIKNISNISKSLLSVWLCLLVISTALTHQHHLVDILSGILLATLINSYFNIKHSVAM